MTTSQRWISAVIVSGTLIGLLLLFQFSTGSRKFERKMVAVIVANCQGNQECLLRPQDVTNFQWDKMFVFGYGASESEVERVLGTKDRWGGEFQRKIVFTNRGKIVFHEEEPTDVEHPLKDEVAFDFPPNSDYGVYSKNVVFKVSEKSSTNGRYFELSEVH